MGRKPVLELLESDPASVETQSLQRGIKGPVVDRMLEICRKNQVRFRTMENGTWTAWCPARLTRAWWPRFSLQVTWM